MEDLLLLADQFIERFNRVQGASVTGLTAEALALLLAHPWPGNIRELENTIERAFILCREGPIGIEHLPEEVRTHTLPSGLGRPMHLAHDLIDAQAIREALDRCAGSRQAAARLLGIHKTTLFRRMKRLGISWVAEVQPSIPAP
jgi:DNA-binding NtrC family response regulator